MVGKVPQYLLISTSLLFSVPHRSQISTMSGWTEQRRAQGCTGQGADQRIQVNQVRLLGDTSTWVVPCCALSVLKFLARSIQNLYWSLLIYIASCWPWACQKASGILKGVIGHSSKIISWDSASSSGLLQHFFALSPTMLRDVGKSFRQFQTPLCKFARARWAQSFPLPSGPCGVAMSLVARTCRDRESGWISSSNQSGGPT